MHRRLAPLALAAEPLRRPLVRHRQHSFGSYFDISFQTGNKLTDVYTAHPKTFDAPTKCYTLNAVPGTGNARWRQSAFWPWYLSYLILYVDPDYRTTLVGHSGRNYGWVFARKPVIDDPTNRSLRGRLRDKGYDVSQFRRVPQVPAQIGNPRFQ
jgi:apolipoprotein D and lipocalin family protein